MAKIAAEPEQALANRTEQGEPGHLSPRLLAQGDGWTVEDVVCTSGPDDHPFEEQHGCYRIAVVLAGSFQYRSESACELMTPGSLLLGNAGQGFECGHEHGTGDRCLSFGYAPAIFEKAAAEAGARGRVADFQRLRVPPLRALSSVVAKVYAGLVSHAPGGMPDRWEELSVQLVAETVRAVRESPRERHDVPARVLATVTRAVRLIDGDPMGRHAVNRLAREAGLSPYHFLRTFERLTGVTPHQYVRRGRLRRAATLLVAERKKIVDVAFDCGFDDVSTFNHAFLAEFGMSPRTYRKRTV